MPPPMSSAASAEEKAKAQPKARPKAAAKAKQGTYKAAAKAKPKAKAALAKSKAITPARAHVYHSAAMNVGRPLAVPGTSGSYLCIDSVGRASISTGNQHGFFIICQWTTSSARAIIVQANPTSRRADAKGGNSAQAVQLSGASPLSVRPLRLSLRLRNVTQSQHVAGSVRALCLSEPLAWEFDAANSDVLTSVMHTKLRAMVESHPKTKSYTAADFMTTREFVMPPASQTQMKSWHDYDPMMLIGAMANATQEELNANLISSMKIAPMHTLILEFTITPTGATNTYEYTVFSQDAARFSADSLYASLQKQPAIASEEQFQQGLAAASSTAGAVVDPSGGGIM